jgi:hypothetical protein
MALTNVDTYSVIPNGDYVKTKKTGTAKINEDQLVMVEALNLSFDPKDSSSEQVEKAYFSSGLTIIVKQGKLS